MAEMVRILSDLLHYCNLQILDMTQIAGYFAYYIRISEEYSTDIYLRSEYYTGVCAHILHSYMYYNRILHRFICNNNIT